MHPLSTSSDKSIVGLPQSPLQEKSEAAETLPNMKTGSDREPETRLLSRHAGASEKLRLEKESSEPEVITRRAAAETDRDEVQNFFDQLHNLFADSKLQDQKSLEALIAAKSHHIKIPQSLASVPFIAKAVSQACSTQCIAHLLQMGSNPDLADDQGNTALSYAVQQGNVEMVQCLLSHHAQVNVAVKLEHYKHTALSMAAYMGNPIITGLLLNHGADVNQVNGSGGTALECAMLSCMVSAPADALSLLLKKGANAEAPFSGAPTFLGYALKLQNTALVKLFLQHGSSLDHPGYIGMLRAMLVYEVAKNNFDFVKSVLSLTGLRTELTKQLLSGPPDGSGSVLSFAVIVGNQLMFAELMHYRADSAYVDSNGLTALMYACASGRAWIVEQLLKAAPLTAILRSRCRDKNDFSALGLAVLLGHDDVLRVMLRYAQEAIHEVVRDRQGDGNLLELVFKSGSPDILKVLFEFGFSVNDQQAGSHATMLMRFSALNKRACVRMLIDQGADVNLRDAVGNNALMYATSAGDIEIIQLLLDNGASLIRNNAGYGPLDVLGSMQAMLPHTSTRFIEIRNLLLQAGRSAMREEDDQGM